MRLAVLLAFRSLLARPSRTFFAVFGIAIGIATVVGIFTLDHNTILGLSQPSEFDWRADIEVSPTVKTLDPRHDLAGIPGVAKVSAFFQNEVLAQLPNDSSKAPCRTRFYGIEISEAKGLGVYRVEEGNDLDAGRRNHEILIGKGLAEDLRLSPGDRLTLIRPPNSAKKLCVDGQIQLVQPDKPLPPRAETFLVAGILARERLGARSRGRLVIADYARGRDLFESVTIGETFVIKRDPRVDIERLKMSLGESYSYDINRQILVGQAADERAFRNGVRFAGLLTMVLGLFVIFHTLSIALIERVREISTLHALGTTRRQIAGVFLLEACVLALLGGVAGLGLGAAIAKILLKLKVTTLGVGKNIEVFEIPWGTVLPLIGVGCAMALLGSVYPILRLKKGSSAAGLGGEQAFESNENSRGFRFFSAVLLAFALPLLYIILVPSVGEFDATFATTLFIGTGFLSLLVGLPLLVPEVLARVGAWFAKPLQRWFPFAGLLASRTLLERPTRIAVGIIGVAMVATAFIVLKGMTNSLSAEIDVWSDVALRDRVFISDIPDVDYETFKGVVLDHPEVLSIEHGSMRTYAPFLIVGIPDDQLRDYGPLQNENLLHRFRERRGIIVSGRLATDLGYLPGDEIPIRTGRGVVELFTVIAVSDDYGYAPHPDERLYGVISARTMANDFCVKPTRVNRVSLRLKDGSDDDGKLLADLRSDLEIAFPGAGKWRYESGRFIHEFFRYDIDRDFFLFDIILGLSALLAAMGLLNGQLLSALERRKEFGILRALGAEPRQIAGATLVEASLTGIIGGLLGLLMGTILSPLVIGALELVSGLPLPTRGAGWFSLYVLIGSWALAVLAVLYPIWRTNRLDPVADLRTG